MPVHVCARTRTEVGTCRFKINKGKGGKRSLWLDGEHEEGPRFVPEPCQAQMQHSREETSSRNRRARHESEGTTLLEVDRWSDSVEGSR